MKKLLILCTLALMAFTSFAQSVSRAKVVQCSHIRDRWNAWQAHDATIIITNNQISIQEQPNVRLVIDYTDARLGPNGEEYYLYNKSVVATFPKLSEPLYLVSILSEDWRCIAPKIN